MPTREGAPQGEPGAVSGPRTEGGEPAPDFASVDSTQAMLAGRDYVADAALATSVFLAVRMRKALFLEGEPGVGKTEVAKVVADALGVPLIRMQCYEGLDIGHAVYEWNYQRQLLEIQRRQTGQADGEAADIFSDGFLLRRPLLQAIDAGHDRAPVLLIDELDRADEEFESFLLELLADFQITIPELGTLRAVHPPLIFITSNRTREIHDALKRRCVYHWIDYPTPEKEFEVVRRKIPEIGEQLAWQIVRFVQAVRTQDFFKRPGVAETLDWARALQLLDRDTIDVATVAASAGVLLKYQDDVDRFSGDVISTLLHEAIA